MKNIFFASILIVLAILFRTVWHVYPNVEFITTASLLGALYLGKKWAIIIPLISIIVSDIFIGNTFIFLFTWSAYLLIGISYLFVKASKSSGYSTFLKGIMLSAGAGVFFYLWTNFGVWLLDSWDMYPNTFAGLISSYVMGLPFLRYTLLGNVIFTGVSIGFIESFFVIKSLLFHSRLHRAFFTERT